MKTTQATIAGDDVNRMTRLLSKIKHLDAEKKYKLANVAKLNGRAAIVYAFHAQLLVKQKPVLDWMQGIIQFCQVYFQKWVIENKVKKDV